jgi:hypothetical protein
MGCENFEIPKLVTRIEVQKVLVPEPLLNCEPEPIPPVDPVTPEAYVEYIFSLATAGDDCRSKLARIKELQTN